MVKVFNLELEDAVEVFQRINQGGKRLTRFELVAANCWSQSSDLAKLAKAFKNECGTDGLRNGGTNHVYTGDLSR